MKEININNLKEAAKSIYLYLSEQEYQALAEKLKILIKQSEIIFINNKDIDQYKPATFPFCCQTTILREDIAIKPLNREEVLKNANDKTAGQIKFPKIL